jgi:hypothetical protein
MATAVDLLRRVARARNAQLQLRELPCHEAWAHFLAGDGTAYAEHVANAVDRHAEPDDQVMLAQASMAPALPLIQRRDIAMATTPAPAIEAALAAYQRAR